MHFFCNCGVVSATAPGVALPPASMQSSARSSNIHGRLIVVLYLCTGMYCMPVSPIAPTVGAGAKTGHKKITIFKSIL